MSDIFNNDKIATETDRQEVINAIKEASISMAQIDLERDNIKAIATRMKEEFEVKPADFNAVAKMYHKQNTEEQKQKRDELFDLYDRIFSKEPACKI